MDTYREFYSLVIMSLAIFSLPGSGPPKKDGIITTGSACSVSFQETMVMSHGLLPSMHSSRGSVLHLSPLTEANRRWKAEMPDDVQAILRGYEPSDTSDDAVHFLRETFKYLPADGRRNLAQDIVQDGAQGKLKQLAQSIITGLLTPLKVAGDKTAQVTPSPRIGLEDSLEGLAAMTDNSTTQDEYPDEVTADLETAHIIPFAITKFVGDAERQRMIMIWVNTARLRELKDTFPLVLEDVYAVVLYSNGSLSAGSAVKLLRETSKHHHRPPHTHEGGWGKDGRAYSFTTAAIPHCPLLGEQRLRPFVRGWQRHVLKWETPRASNGLEKVFKLLWDGALAILKWPGCACSRPKPRIPTPKMWKINPDVAVTGPVANLQFPARQLRPQELCRRANLTLEGELAR